MVSKVCLQSCFHYSWVRSHAYLKKVENRYDLFVKIISIPFKETLFSRPRQQLCKRQIVINFLPTQPLFCAPLRENQVTNTRIKMQPIGNSKPPSSKVEEEYSALLIKQIETISQWRDLPEHRQEKAVEKFMDAIGRLYLDHYQFHITESRALATKYSELIEDSIIPIISYVSNLEHALNTADDMDDPWETACWGRTNIEAVKTMFGEPMKHIDSSGIEEYMLDRKGNAQLKNSLIPKNVPSSHWWWFEKYR